MDIVIRAAVVFAFLYLLMRMLGRRELSSMEPFDIILLVVIGDLVQQGVTQSDYSVTGALLAVSTIALLTVLVSWASFPPRPLRRVLEGDPIALAGAGNLMGGNLGPHRPRADGPETQAGLKQ